MAYNQTEHQEHLQEIIHRDQEIQKRLEEAREKADQRVAGARGKAVQILEKARGEAHKKSREIKEQAQFEGEKQVEGGKRIWEGEKPGEKSLSRAADYLVQEILGWKGA